MSLPTAQQRRRTNLWFGIVMIATGLGMIGDGIYEYRTGITTAHKKLEWWQEVPVGVGLIFLGGLLGWGKEPPQQ